MTSRESRQKIPFNDSVDIEERSTLETTILIRPTNFDVYAQCACCLTISVSKLFILYFYI